MDISYAPEFVVIFIFATEDHKSHWIAILL